MNHSFTFNHLHFLVPSVSHIKSQPSLRVSSDSLSSVSRAGPVVPWPPDQVAAGVLQVPLVAGQDPDAVVSGAEAQRVQLLHLRRHRNQEDQMPESSSLTPWAFSESNKTFRSEDLKVFVFTSKQVLTFKCKTSDERCNTASLLKHQSDFIWPEFEAWEAPLSQMPDKMCWVL